MPDLAGCEMTMVRVVQPMGVAWGAGPSHPPRGLGPKTAGPAVPTFSALPVLPTTASAPTRTPYGRFSSRHRSLIPLTTRFVLNTREDSQ